MFTYIDNNLIKFNEQLYYWDGNGLMSNVTTKFCQYFFLCVSTETSTAEYVLIWILFVK